MSFLPPKTILSINDCIHFLLLIRCLYPHSLILLVRALFLSVQFVTMIFDYVTLMLRSLVLHLDMEKNRFPLISMTLVPNPT